MGTEKSKVKNMRLIPLLAIAFALALMSKPVYAQLVDIIVDLNGAQEVPPVETTGTGVANIIVDTATGEISGTVEFSGLSAPATQAHIHTGAAGVDGPFIITLVGGEGLTAGSMSIPDGARLLPRQLNDLMADRLFINIHTLPHPGGEIRGQIPFTSAM